MDAMSKVLAFLVVLGVLVVFHELGHYWVARWCRVKVLRFSVGFGRVVWSRRFGPDRTEWAVSAIPLGGYVKMVDEREGTVPRGRPRRARSIGRASGSGSRSSRPDRSPTCCSPCCSSPAPTSPGFPAQRALLAAPPANTPAAAAGVRDGDLVVAADGAPVRSWQDLRWRLLRASGARGDRASTSNGRTARACSRTVVARLAFRGRLGRQFHACSSDFAPTSARR